MSEQVIEDNLPTDPFLQLLTDALRAGPGSPEWHQAVARVNAGERGPSDEYALLINARENLASGKDYRQVRAGAGFTHKVMARISKDVNEAAAKKSPISASLITYIGAGLVVAAFSVLIFWLMSRNTTSESEDLSNLFFTRTIASATLDAPLNQGWRLIGPVDLDPAKGLVPTLHGSTAGYTGGAVVSTEGVSPKDQFEVEATFQFQQISAEVIPQLFVTDDQDFKNDKATSQHELTWMVREKQQQVGQAQVMTPDGKLTLAQKSIDPGKSISVRIVIGATNAVVMNDGAIIWSGPHQLAADKPRYVGVRLLCRKDEKRVTVSVKDLRELAK